MPCKTLNVRVSPGEGRRAPELDGAALARTAAE
jgi:hypothetical protein